MTSVSERFRLDGRLALITGSSAGIGLAIARGLAQAGARVVLNGRTAETLHASAETLRSEGLEAHSRVFDVTDSESELARPGIAPYTASKGALKMLTKGMAVDWGPHGLNVNGIPRRQRFAGRSAR